ncbi:TPA: tail fiber domain-containing protein [Escherichia coli]
MALYRRGTASMDADGTVHGTDTKWKDKLALIRVGATIVFLEQPIKLAVISDIVSDTELKAISTDGQTAADGKYVILLNDSLTVNGLAQNVAEALRYYQSKETEIAAAIDIINQLDMDKLEQIVAEVNQAKSDSQAAQNQAELARDAANAARDDAVSSKDAAAVSAQEAKDAANSINAENLLTKDGNLSGLEDKKQSRKNLQLGEDDLVTFEGVAVKNKAVNANASNAGIYYSILYGDDGSDIGSSQSYFETQRGVGKHTIGVSKSGGGVNYYQLHENGTFTGAKRIELTPGGTFMSLGNKYNHSQLYSLPNPRKKSWTGLTKHVWYNDYVNAGLIRGGDTNIESYAISISQAGRANYIHSFYPDGRTHSAQYTGITQKLGWDAPNNWGNALVWGETVLNNDGGWAPGLSWATQSTGGYPIRATWGLISQGNNKWPLCSLRLKGDRGMFCTFHFSPSTNDITTWSSSGNFIFQKAANSDRDIKHDIIYTDGKDSYDRVMQWLPTMFKYNGSEIQRYGMIAQDLLKIDREYVKIIPGGDIFAEVIGLDDDGNEYVDREIVVDKADDTLALDNNVIMADMACAMVYMGNRMEEMRKELDEIKKILSK